MSDCDFCTEPGFQSRIFLRNQLVVASPTRIPITPGHALVCPIRHVATIAELTDEEVLGLRQAIIDVEAAARSLFGAEGFNVAWNQGKMAGQSLSHIHIHVVPRQTGDTGIYKYEPRQFLYRPGERETSPEEELMTVANQYRSAIKTEVTA